MFNIEKLVERDCLSENYDVKTAIEYETYNGKS